jgi:hypothetical protein
MANRTTALTLALFPPGTGNTVSGQDVYGTETVTVTVTTPAGHGDWTATGSSGSGSVSISPSSNPSGNYCTITAVNTGTYTVYFESTNSSSEAEANGNVSGTVLASVAPTASSVTIPTTNTENTTATVNLSASGSGGPLQYACEVDDATPDNWQDEATFTISRGSGTVYARARRGTTNSNIVSVARPGFLTGDTSVSASNDTISSGASSASTNVTSGTSTDTYAVRVNNGSANLGTRTGNGAISFGSVGTLPTTGNSSTYEIFVRRPTSTGGDGSTYTATNVTFTVTRLVSPPTDISFSDPGTELASVDIAVTASGGEAGGTLYVASAIYGSSWAANGTTYSLTRGEAYYFLGRVEHSGSASINYVEPVYTVPYLTTSTAGTISANPTNPAYTGNTSPTITLTIGSKTANHDYYVGTYIDGTLVSGTNALVSGYSTTRTLAANSGSTATYTLTVIRPANKGGNASVVNTVASVTVTRAIAPPTAVYLVPGTDENSSTSVTATASGNFFAGGGTTLYVSQSPYSTWEVNGYSFTGKNRGTPYTFKGKRIVGGVSSTLASATLTVPYLATTQSGALTVATIAYSAPTSYTMGFDTAVPGTHDYRINSGDANSAAVTVPATAGNHAFSLQTRRKVASGGDPALTWSGSFGEINITRSEDSSGNAPVISSVTNNNNAGTSVTATVNLSSSGSGGTLEYAQTSSNSVPSTGWEDENTFTHARGTTKYYWARQSAILVGAVESHAVGYRTGNTDVAASNDTISSSANSASTNVTLGTSGETYAVRVENGSTNLADRTGNGAISFTGSLPTGTNTTTYEIFVRRPTSTGGDGSTYTATNDTFTVNRQAAGGGGGTSYGLQIRNASDQLVLEVSDRAPRFVSTGSEEYTTLDDAIEVDVTGMTDDDTWTVVVNSTVPYGGVEVEKVAGGFEMKQTGLPLVTLTANLRYIVLRT